MLSIESSPRCQRSLLASVVGALAIASVGPAGAVDLTFQRIIVDGQMTDGHAVSWADFDRDGDTDIVSTSEDTNLVAWFENTGQLRFLRRVIDDQLGGAYPVSVGDLNQDGQVDVLAAGYKADRYVWYQNRIRGLGRFSARRRIDAIEGPHSIVPVDMDDDGDIDVLAGAQDANRVAWYENDGRQRFTENVIDQDSRRTKTAYPSDLDGDGDLDVVATSFLDNTVAWYRRNPNGSFTKFVIRSNFFGAYYALPADVDMDGDPDIVVASKDDDMISWLRNDGPPSCCRHRLRFEKIVLDTNCTGARSVRVGDLDGDGDNDIVAACRNNPDAQVTWYENRGGGTFGPTRVVSDEVNAAYGVHLVDIDGDSRLDVLSAGGKAVSVHRQTTPFELLGRNR